MIDTHVHFWNYHPVKEAWITEEMKAIQRDFNPEDLLKASQDDGLSACLAVQADQSEQETEFLLAYAYQYSFIRGVIGWIDFRSELLPERLANFADQPKLKGWRHIAQPEPDGFLIADSFVRGIAALDSYDQVYEILIGHRQLPDALTLINKFPDQNFVLDHLAKPPIATKRQDQTWAQAIAELAKHPKIYAKASGMVTEADWQCWQPDDFKYYLDVLFENFGPERIMFGSDWPVCTLAANYQQTLGILKNYTAQLSPEQQYMVFEGTAKKCYKL